MSQELYVPPSLRIERSWLADRVPAYLLLPREQERPLPAVVLLHGFTDKKEEPYHIALRLAQVGFVACGIDAWGHGERQAGPFPTEQAARSDFLLRVFQETGADVLTVLEELSRRPEVRADALGITGVSMGGSILHYVLTLTDRLRAAVAFIATAEWDAYIEEASDQQLRQFAEAAAPLRHAERYPPVALLLLNGAQDDRIPLKSAQRTYDRLRPAYARHPERLRFEVDQAAGHRVNVQMGRAAVAWLQQQLQDGGSG